jgi:NADH-quinone oxidoreductase subunit E
MSGQPFSSLVEGLKGETGDLIPALQRAQAANGYLSTDIISRISRWLRISENEIYGVATFYSQFRFTRPGDCAIRVCLGTACHVRGGEQILDVLMRRLQIRPGETTPDGRYQLDRVACLGCCALAPVLAVDDRIHAQASVLKVQELLGGPEEALPPAAAGGGTSEPAGGAPTP